MLLWCSLFCCQTEWLSFACASQAFLCWISAGRLAAYSLFLQIWMCGWDSCGQWKHKALCVVGSDMSRLSIDRDVCLRELLRVKISNGVVVVLQYQGSLLSFVLVGISVIKHMCELTVWPLNILENVLFIVLRLCRPVTVTEKIKISVWPC